MALHSIKTYTATGTTQDFAVPFPFLLRSHITVTQDGNSVAFTFINDGKITITPTVLTNDKIKITRSTSSGTRLTNFTSPSSLTTTNLNNSALQLFYLAQEALDGQEQDSDASTSAAAAAVSATAAAASAASAEAVATDFNIWAGTASGTDTILLTPSAAITSYSTGMKVRFIPAGVNTGAVTINVSSVGSKTGKKQGGVALIAGDIPATSIVEFTYDGTDFFLDTGIGGILKSGDSMTGALNQAQSSDLSSATTTDIGAVAGNYVEVTGTTTITGLGTIQAGTQRIVRFIGVLILTHNGTSLILPTSANITTAANDFATFISLGSGNWICTDYTRASGLALIGGLPFATTGDIGLSSGSPTSVLLLSSLVDVNEIEIHITGFSTNTADQAPMFQIGDSGGLETSGYTGLGWSNAASTARSSNSVGFLVGSEANQDAGNTATFILVLRHMGSNLWSAQATGSNSVPALIGGDGLKTLSAALDRVSITTSGGSATFDNGTARARSR